MDNSLNFAFETKSIRIWENHIHKEDNVIFNFAKRSLNEDIRKIIDEECFEYEEKNSFTREENIGITFKKFILNYYFS